MPSTTTRRLGGHDVAYQVSGAAGPGGVDVVLVHGIGVSGPPHIPGCCALPGAAANVEIATPGHFRLLADPRLAGVVLEQVAALAVRPTRGAPGGG